MSEKSQRIDQWLYFSRLLKSREKAQDLIREGHVRLNGKRCDAPAQMLRPSDVLTLSQEHQIRIIRILATAQRRGPYEEARLLYIDEAEAVKLVRQWP